MDIIGIGIDIVEIERIERAFTRWGRAFLNHVYCPDEIAYCLRQKKPAPHLAARFAAKEAVFKALPSQNGVGWKDICIVHDRSGRPLCRLSPHLSFHHILITLSHSKTHAIAQAVVTQKSPGE